MVTTEITVVFVGRPVPELYNEIVLISRTSKAIQFFLFVYRRMRFQTLGRSAGKEKNKVKK